MNNRACPDCGQEEHDGGCNPAWWLHEKMKHDLGDLYENDVEKVRKIAAYYDEEVDVLE